MMTIATTRLASPRGRASRRSSRHRHKAIRNKATRSSRVIRSRAIRRLRRATRNRAIRSKAIPSRAIRRKAPRSRRTVRRPDSPACSSRIFRLRPAASRPRRLRAIRNSQAPIRQLRAFAPGQRQPSGTPGDTPATPAPPNDEVVIAPPAQKIPNNQAVFSGLDKITGRIISFDVYIDETVQFGALQVTPRVCYTRPPTETPNTDAFIEVDEITLQGEIKRLFTGWMFAASPGLHAIEHPIYDIWLSDCKGPQTPAVAEAEPAAAQPPPRGATQAKQPSRQKQAVPQPPGGARRRKSWRRHSRRARSSCRDRRSRNSSNCRRRHSRSFGERHRV